MSWYKFLPWVPGLTSFSDRPLPGGLNWSHSSLKLLLVMMFITAKGKQTSARSNDIRLISLPCDHQDIIRTILLSSLLFLKQHTHPSCAEDIWKDRYLDDHCSCRDLYVLVQTGFLDFVRSSTGPAPFSASPGYCCFIVLALKHRWPIIMKV